MNLIRILILQFSPGISLLCGFVFQVEAQNNLKTNWIINPFENKAFVENKGQFDGKDGYKRNEIAYGVEREGVGIYFSPRGLTIRHDIPEPDKVGGEQEEDHGYRKIIRVNMEWIGASNHAQIVAEDKWAHYYTYADVKDATGKTSLQAEAFRKLKYLNLYPGIDVEYSFPEGKSGFKYVLIVHPGADLSRVKMKYSSSDKLGIKKDNMDLHIQTLFGEIVDHAPLTTDQSGHVLKSAFNLNGKVVSFYIQESYDPSQTLIIDPWTVTPPFNRPNAYDVDYDTQGNVYAYGRPGGFSSACQLVKMNSLSNILWIFNATSLSSTYGDFAVDANSQSVYVVDGWGSTGFPALLKLNPAGAQTGVFVGTSTMNEMWRIFFNNCTGKAVIGGGGLTGTNQLMALDTNLLAMTPVNTLGATASQHDVCLLALDNAGDCYMLFSKAYPPSQSALFNNVLVKAPLNALATTSFSVSGNYAFREYTIPLYGHNVVCNGFNGISVSNKFLYTYDGKLLQRWNKTNGTLISSTNTTTLPMVCAGLSVDQCDRIFAGVQRSIVQYDTTFATLNTINLPDTVYDIKLGPGNALYASGRGFVGSFQVNNSNQLCGSCSLLSVSSTVHDPVCYGDCTGSATVSVNSGGTPPYQYSWNTTPVQTSATATGLCAGTYTCTITDALHLVNTSLVTVNQPPAIQLVINQSNLSCFGNCNGRASVLTSGGTGTLHYSWSTNPVQTGDTISGLCAGNYTCTVRDSIGCTTFRTVSITQPPVLIANAYSVPACGANQGNADVQTRGGAPGYSYSWNTTPPQFTAAISGLQSGIYTCWVTDSNGCGDSASVHVFAYAKPIITLPSGIVINYKDTLMLHPQVSGLNTYTWFPATGLSCNTCPDPLAQPLSTTTYCLEVISNEGCGDTACTTITVDMNCGEVFVPTAFSPNGDGHNDLECVYGNCVESMTFSIYDRWGEKVFSSSDPEVCWDGTFRGEQMNNGIFVYELEAKLITGKTIHQKGNISLVR
jgi:gliding motility-associated-like protein